MERTSHFADINGPVHYVEYGGTGDPIVMLHGLGASHLNWDRMGPQLAESHRAYAVDLRGFGLTPLDGNTASLSSQVNMVARFIAEVAGGTATVFGNSMGGTIAMLLAAEHPALVKRLVLVSPGLPLRTIKSLRPRNLMFFGLPLLPVIGEAAMRRYSEQTSPEGRIKYLMEAMTADPNRVDHATRQSFVEMLRLRDSMEWAPRAYNQAVRSLTWELTNVRAFRSAIHRITAPTLLIHGMLDDTVPIEAAEWLAKERPDWKYVPIADCGHVAHIELPKRSLAIYRKWREQSPEPVAL